MKAQDELLRNSGNDSAVSDMVRQYFYKYPNSKPKECCKALRLDYSRYGGRIRKIKHDLKRFRQSIVPVTDQYGRPLKPLAGIHRQEYQFSKSVPVDFVASIVEKAQLCRVKARWYRSPNRNKQLEYFDDRVSIRVYPKSGTCRILPHRAMLFEELRVEVEDAFAKVLSSKQLLSDPFDRMIRGLQTVRQHRTFYVGPVTPFRIGFYRNCHGLDILADRSHPEHLEVLEDWPAWIPALFEAQRSQNFEIRNNSKVLAEFTSQIKCHLRIMEGIGLAADRLNETIHHLTQIVGKLHSGNDGRNDSASEKGSLESEQRFPEG